MVSRPVSLFIASAAVFGAVGLQSLMPALPPFIFLFPAVWLAAYFGGPIVGTAAIFISTVFAVTRQTVFADGYFDRWEGLGALAFLGGSGVAVFLVHRYQAALRRLDRERLRLRSVLRAANAATWEIDPMGRLTWDENFYALVGLDPQVTPPTTETFLSMVHPDDRERMAAARRAIDAGGNFSPFDEYRLIRPNHEMVWLENHRTRTNDGSGSYVIGITQDVTRRKLAEEKVQLLLREASHRAKNQFAVIQAIARETIRSTSPEAFEAAFSQRLAGLARSHDLLVNGNLNGISLGDLVSAHLAPFGAEPRAALTGPALIISANAAQYLGMALHELSTNATKYGALSVETGSIDVTWAIEASPSGDVVVVVWQERGGPPVIIPEHRGFGSRVLLRLAPSALFGEAELSVECNGLRWRFTAPFQALTSEEHAG